MKVSENNTALNDYSSKLDSKLQHHIANKEIEIEKVKKLYDQKVEDSKNEGEEKYLKSLQKNDNLLISATKDYEDKLNNYKVNLEKTQKSIGQEESVIKSDQIQKLENFKNQNRTKIDDEFKNASDIQQQVHLQSQEQLKNISDKSRFSKNQLESNARNELNFVSAEYNQKGITTEREYKASLDNNIKAHQAEVLTQKTELKEALDRTAEQSKRLESEKRQVQTQELNFLDGHQKDVISQKQSDFKVRYETLVKEHESLLNQLKTHFDNDVKKLVSKNASQKEMIENKVNDSFYRVETLNPSIKDLGSELHIDLKVPEYEKENVHLSVHGRGVKMTLSRKFTDSTEEDDGATNKSTRNELFSKEFPSKDILNPKLVTQKYENGILSYKIQKL